MQQNHSNHNYVMELDIRRLISALWKQKILIVVVTVLFTLGGYLHSLLFLEPLYRSSFTAYVNNRVDPSYGTAISPADISASLGLSGVYQEIVVSRGVLSEVAENTSYGLKHTDIARMVKCNMSSDTNPVVHVTVVAGDPQMACDLANAIADVAPEHMARVIHGCKLVVIDRAIPDSEKVWPNNPGRGLTTGSIAGLLLCLLIVVIDLIDDKVQNSEELERRYGLPTIGQIPSLEAAEKSENYYQHSNQKKGGRRR